MVADLADHPAGDYITVHYTETTFFNSTAHNYNKQASILNLETAIPFDIVSTNDSTI